MNWSTRLRRWVRIRTPPVRVASMKPTAATVLPAPVACSNQKRRSAPGSSRRPPRRRPRPRRRGPSVQSWGSSSSSSARLRGRPRPPPSSSSSLASSASARRLRPARARRRLRLRPPRTRSRRSSAGDLLLGHQLGQGAGERVDLVRVELGAVAQRRRLVGEQALEAEQQREVPAPLDRGVLGAGVDLAQRGVERAAAGGAGRQRLGPLAVEQEGLAGERRRTLDVGA